MSKILTDLTKIAECIAKDPDLETNFKQDDLDDLVSYIERFPRYFGSVIMAQVTSMLLSIDKDERSVMRYENADRNRRQAHIALTTAVNLINRRAMYYGLEPVFVYEGVKEHKLESGSMSREDQIKERQAIDDRETAAHLVYGVCKEIFLDAQSKEKYNEFENYTKEQMDEELYEMASDGVSYFEERMTLEELFEEARVNANDGEEIGDYEAVKEVLDER